MSRFEVTSAWVLGVALPLLEMVRRRTHFHPIASYADDFIAGGLLIWAARAARRGSQEGAVALCVAWGVVCGGFYYSFFGQIEHGAATDVSGVRNGYVAAIKGLLFCVSILSLVSSYRHAMNNSALPGGQDEEQTRSLE